MILCLWAKIWPVHFLQLVRLSWYIVPQKTPLNNYLKNQRIDLFECVIYDRHTTSLMCSSQPESRLQEGWRKPDMIYRAVTHHYRSWRRGKFMQVSYKIYFLCCLWVCVCVCAEEMSLPGKHITVRAGGHLGLEMSLNDRGVNLLPMCRRGRQLLSSQINKVNSKHSHFAIWNQPFNELLFL